MGYTTLAQLWAEIPPPLFPASPSTASFFFVVVATSGHSNALACCQASSEEQRECSRNSYVRGQRMSVENMRGAAFGAVPHIPKYLGTLLRLLEHITLLLL